MEIKRLKNGKICATARVGTRVMQLAERNFNAERTALLAELESNAMPTIRKPTIRNRRVRIGDVGCLCLGSNVSPDCLRSGKSEDYEVWLYDEESGYPGNSNPGICRLHGWRGTTQNFHVTAEGWRRVESIDQLKRGLGFRVVLSEDMRPNEP